MTIDPVALSFVTSLASTALYTGIQLVSHKIATKLSDAEQKELEQVYRRAFTRTFETALGEFDKDLQLHIVGIFEDFFDDKQAREEITSLALRQNQPDFNLIINWFNRKGYDIDTLPISFEQTLQSLVRNLEEDLEESASNPGSKLHNRVILA